MMNTTIENIKSGNTQVLRSMANYARMGIDIKIVEDLKTNKPTVIIAQKRLVNGFILNQKELVERAKEVFATLDIDLVYKPVMFSLDTGIITTDWINNKMDEYGLKNKDIVRLLALDKSSVSSFLSGNRNLTKVAKAGFYYLFLTFELNRELRKL